MTFFNMSPENQQRIAVFVPIIALLLSIFVVYPGWGRHGELNTEIDMRERELAALKSSPPPMPGSITPAVTDEPSEPPAFLGQLTLLAQASNCRIVGFEALAPNSTPGVTQVAGLVRPVRARVDLAGTYPEVRHFLYLLGKAPRLYVVAGVKIKSADDKARSAPSSLPVRTYEGVSASFEIERYVASPPPVPRAG